MMITTFAASLVLMQAAPEPDTQEAQDVGVEESQEAEGQPGPASAPATDDDPNIDVVETRKKKITDRSHPDYVRCKSEAVIGSRARRKRTCMTNREWERASRRGNEATRDFVQENQPGFLNNGPGSR